jgi:hypothetical protein
MVGEVAMRRGVSEGARRMLGFVFLLQQIHSSPHHRSLSTSPLLTRPSVGSSTRANRRIQCDHLVQTLLVVPDQSRRRGRDAVGLGITSE